MIDEKKQREQFLKALDKDDFALGDTFWVGDWKFEVIDCSVDMKKIKNYMLTEEEKCQLKLL